MSDPNEIPTPVVHTTDVVADHDEKSEETVSSKATAAAAGINEFYYKTVDTFMTRMGAPDPSAPVPPDVINAVEEIIGKGLEGGGPPTDNRVTDIVWGWATQGLAERQKAVYYRINVSESQAESGFVLQCRSKNKSKLRLFVYDKTGSLVDKADAYKSRDGAVSQAILVFSSAETLRMEAQMDVSTLAHWNKAPSSVFSKLNGLIPNTIKLIPAGTYLIAVYIDNAIMQGPFSLVALPSKTGEEQATVLHTEKSIVEAKERLVALESEYIATKSAYEAALAKMRDEEDMTEALMQTREDAYKSYLHVCGSAYTLHDGDSGTLEFDEFADKPLTPLPIDPSKILQAAGEKASFASGWLANKFAYGISHLQKAATSGLNADSASVSSVEGQHSGTVNGDELVDEKEESAAHSAEATKTAAATSNTTATTTNSSASASAAKTSDIDDMFDDIVGASSSSSVKPNEKTTEEIPTEATQEATNSASKGKRSTKK